MSNCRYDRETGEYLIDGEPCKVDDYGDPTKHCTARRTCSVHIGADELTCPRCIARTRAQLRRIPVLAALAEPIAVTTGINSPAANVSGPAADPEAWSWRKIAAKQGRAWHLSLIEEDDDEHPLTVLGRWEFMIREDYDQPSDQQITVSSAAAYLDSQLARIANDPEQDWPLFTTEIRKCQRRLETIDALARFAERGAPCPDCAAEGVSPKRLVREYAHWCDDEDCTRMHYDDDSEDRWVCPRNRDHWRTVSEYENYLAERRTSA
jgi:hypothetical protein